MEENTKKGTLKLIGKEKIDGKDVEEINYNFLKLKGKDIARIKREMAGDKKGMAMVETDTDFHTYLFAAASGVPVMKIYTICRWKIIWKR